MHGHRMGSVCASAAAALLVLLTPSAQATTKGLNQIVTPDIQATRVFSLSVQAQDGRIGNPLQLQYEVGIARGLEIAASQGLRPGQTALHVEASLLDCRPWLVGAGVMNWDPRARGSQPFVVAGYSRGAFQYVAGLQHINSRTQVMAGAAWQQSDHLQFQTDYLSGSDNFATLGLTWTVTSQFSVNPAVYVSNAAPHRMLGYLVTSWSFRF